jgi:hypothetical protein
MKSGISFIRISDRVEVTVDLKGKRVRGPPVLFKQEQGRQFSEIITCHALSLGAQR